MDFGYEDRLPSEHRYVDAMSTPEKPKHVPQNWLWLERYFPYSEAGNNLHWFIRFPE